MGAMSGILFGLMLVAMLAALIVVIIGVLSMARSADPNNAKRQNKLMQMRVMLQGLALLLAFLAFAVFAG